MQRKTIDTQKTKADLAELLYLVFSGTEVVLSEGSIPCARMVPVVAPTTPRVAVLHMGSIQTKDFDGPLSENC